MDGDNILPFRRRSAVPQGGVYGVFPRIDIDRNREDGSYVVGIVYSQGRLCDFVLCGWPPTYAEALSIARAKQAELEAEIGPVQIIDFSSVDTGTDVPDIPA